ncbi:DUF1517 domain-containing protein [Prochlorococcus sp. MIT 0801]|uniref:DUF1517 domain-containing protein n=1 Tax=Prochlorococcus sp. MIT 0801 TaxID=1501269 RepID=UPI0004F5FB4E|nr:DUF1517 domain-containing protein [Prochlorococcus sp. MIT 0801]AIQ97845.1 hypothetical protein EW15_1753 [Prochlorococcus sp. MIT 0801]
MFKTTRLSWIKRKQIFSFLVVSTIIFFSLFTSPNTASAASGGRIGGGSFQAPSSSPRRQNYGGYGGNNFRGYGSGYRGGGIGFPFLLPIFGFGGGGIFGFLILMSIVGVIVNSFKSSSNFSNASNNSIVSQSTNPSKVSLIQFQIGLLASAKEIQVSLRELAASSNTSTSSGLQRVLQDTTLSLLRQPELWVYSNIETGSVPYASAESTFNRISITERSKLKAELTSNYSGQISSSTNKQSNPGDSDSTNEYIAITILVATKKDLRLQNSVNNEVITEALRILGSISSNDLIALEVIWQPDGEGETLREEELIIQYPNLKHL